MKYFTKTALSPKILQQAAAKAMGRAIKHKNITRKLTKVLTHNKDIKPKYVHNLIKKQNILVNKNINRANIFRAYKTRMFNKKALPIKAYKAKMFNKKVSPSGASIDIRI